MRAMNQLKQHERRVLAERFFLEQLSILAKDGSLCVLRDLEAFGADAAGQLHGAERVTRVQAAAVAMSRAALELFEPDEAPRYGPTVPTVEVRIPGLPGRLGGGSPGETSAGG